MTLKKSIKPIDVYFEIKNIAIDAVVMQYFPRKWRGKGRLNIQPWISRNKPILERKDVDGIRDGRTQANLKRKAKNPQCSHSVYESYSSKETSIQKLTLEFKGLVLENDEWEFHHMAELKDFLPHLSKEVSTSKLQILTKDI